jgi:hypothetical protein
MKNSIEFYLVEGECEDSFIKSSNLIGRVECLDLSEKSSEQINKWSTKLPGNKKKIFLNIVFDTDVLIDRSSHLCKFIENVKFLKKKGFNVRLLQQHRNFEEELIYCLKINKKELFNKFNARNIKEFKHNFINEKKKSSKLIELNSSMVFWTSVGISQLEDVKEHLCCYDVLPKKP